MTAASFPDSPLVLRDRLVRALTHVDHQDTTDEALLAVIDAAGAALLLQREGVALVLLVWNEAGGLAELTARLKRVTSSARPGRTHVVLVGGPESARPALRASRPFLLNERRLTVHQLSLAGTLWSAGRGLRPLTRAVASLAQPPDSQGLLAIGEVAALRERFRQVASAEQAFASKLARARPYVTWTLVAVLLAIFGLEHAWGTTDARGIGAAFGILEATLWRMGALRRDAVLDGELFRLFSAAFLHGGLIHLMVNTWGLWAVGTFVERLFGSARLVTLYALAALGGAIASAALHADVSSVGASGALSGLLGAVVALALHPRGLLPIAVAAQIRTNLSPVLLVNVVISMLPRVDWSAHLGGFLAGALLVGTGALLQGLRPDAPRAETPRWLRVCALALALAMALSVTLALAKGRAWELNEAPRFERVELSNGVSLLIPTALARPPPERSGARTTWTFGAPHRDLARVRIELSPHAVVGGDALAALEGGVPDFLADLPEALRSKPSVRDLDGRLALELRWQREGESFERWRTDLSGVQATITVELSPAAEPSWQALGDAVFAGISRRGEGPAQNPPAIEKEPASGR